MAASLNALLNRAARDCRTQQLAVNCCACACSALTSGSYLNGLFPPGRRASAAAPSRAAAGLAAERASGKDSWDPTQNPLELVRSELHVVSDRIRRGVTSDIPSLSQAATYFFQASSEGKRIRPSLCLLLSSALSHSSPPDGDVHEVDTRPVSTSPTETRRRQQRIAEIAELIHVASLLHDDVIDRAETRRGKKALNYVLGNKLAILAGDFLLARASMTLASLKDTAVVSLMSQILEDLVSGEVLQATADKDLNSLDLYTRKTYLKTASLMANSCKATAVITDVRQEDCERAFEFGKNLGMAFQITDDILDFTSKSLVLGKPALNDIKSGVITCPVLFAAEEHPELRSMIARRFQGDGDVAEATRCVYSSRAIERATALAEKYVAAALDDISALPSATCEHATRARTALRQLCLSLLKRQR